MPRPRRYDDATVRSALAAQWALLEPAFEAADRAAGVRLPGWDVDRLGGHVTGTVRRIVKALDRPAPARPGLTLAGYYELDAPEPDPPYGLPAAVAEARVALDAVPADHVVAIDHDAM